MSGCDERRAPVRAALLAALLAAALLAGCAGQRTQAPPAAPPAAAPAGTEIAGIATALIGTRYHFGGADAAGFDCSGLALYVYEQAGIAIPRTAAAQQRAAQPVPLGALAPGDLVFFHIRSRSIDHVGIYTGDGRFIHAPRAGVAVSYADLSSGFYARHLAGGGRFTEAQAR
ncbi:MAG TPA: C40 family peptidase [Steroidobacteraceae bacterium]|jgi:cell wall-associated NlpC family hydrolase|nr:C40 family peptidase [Steroidobacteraceae bacterium]